MNELVDAIKNSLKRKSSSEEYIIMNAHYVPVLLSVDNFHLISDLDNSDKLSNLTFVDGGQAVIYDTPGLAIGFLRIGAITYNGLKKQDKTKNEFYVLVTFDQKFVVNTFPKTKFDGMIFDPDDESLKNGIDRCLPSRIISVIRRYAELDLASNYDLCVLDGTLEARYPNELSYISKLKNVTALSKTCALTLNTGESVTRRLYSLKKGVWSYYPIVENHNKSHPAEIYFVKLHDGSKHVFRAELKSTLYQDALFNSLALQSTDPVFYGYPYGLIAVDEFARVSEEEGRFLKTKLNMKLGQSLSELELEEHSIDAHAILDNIKF